MPQPETAPAGDRGGVEQVVTKTTSSTKSGTKSQPCSDALDKVRKAMAPATPKISWRQILKVHPAADKVPVASDDERRRLRGDLCRNGLIEPVVLVRVAGGPLKLLDGRHRLDGLQDNGVEVINSDGDLLVSHKVLDLADDAAALRMALSLNLFRRHLSVDARRAMVKTLLIASPEISDRQGSKVVGLSHPTFAKERKSLEAKGDVEIFFHVEGQAGALPTADSGDAESRPGRHRGPEGPEPADQRTSRDHTRGDRTFRCSAYEDRRTARSATP